MNYPCVESLIEFEHKDKLVRFWIDKTKEELDFPNTLEKTFSYIALIKQVKQHLDSQEFNINEFTAWAQANINNLNALQVSDLNVTLDGKVKLGTVIYLINFSEDVHG